METIEEALRYAVSKTTLYSMSYKGGMEVNYKGLAKEIKEFLDAQKN
jgi:hypothetical protein